MALTTCLDCGGKLSDTAPACPHCGRPSTTPSWSTTRAQPLHGQLDGLAARTANNATLMARWIVFGFIGLVVLGLVVGAVQLAYQELVADSRPCAEAKTKARLAWGGRKFVAVYGPDREFTTTEMLQHAATACGKDPDKTDLPTWLGLHH